MSAATYWLQYHDKGQHAGTIHRDPFSCEPSSVQGFHWHSFPHFHGTDLLRDGAVLCGDCFPHMENFGGSDE
jgi:hypothetical protein